MKSNELRVGNYVKGIGHKISWLVDGIEPEYIYSSKAWRTINSFEGIPLTEEWLLKFGFIEKSDVYFYNDYCIEDIHNGVNWVLNEFDYVKDYFIPIGKCIKHVHQLQNLYFALTGDELTIKDTDRDSN